ncbi:RES family NAD+ phosphorylase [Pantoea sp. 1B4]|nr:RES family NAD+ phosphorylase [Pantoea sp. 1B4]
MNASGIPVFYGAASAEVAIAEVRPAVGSYVVVAPFEAMRALRVLDISSLELISHEKGSKFNPEVIKRLEKSSFFTYAIKNINYPSSRKECGK